MATLILEIPTRHTTQYHKLEKAVIRVGRALDNDIILPDPTVSPYHFVLRRNTDGVYELRSLAEENGIRVGSRQVKEPLVLTDLPLAFEAGRTHIRLHDSSQPVAPTRLISCRNGGTCLFGHRGWALLLFAALVLLSAVDNYLSTPETLSWESFWRDQVVIVTAALGLAVGLMVINRLTSQRWDLASSLSFVSLVLIAAALLDEFIRFADYFMTSPLPGFALSLAWSLLLLPVALGWFLVRFHHGNTVASMVFIILLLSPAAYLQVSKVLNHYDILTDFSNHAYYSDSLYPGDTRLQQTLSVDDFADLSGQLLKPEVFDD
jgi:hypothetical protein